MGKMRAKMRVSKIESFPVDEPTQQTLHFDAVGRSEAYPDDGSDENNTYARWTPTAHVELCVVNPALIGAFNEGEVYYVDFTKVD